MTVMDLLLRYSLLRASLFLVSDASSSSAATKPIGDHNPEQKRRRQQRTTSLLSHALQRGQRLPLASTNQR
ncbi:uncharacterized protein DS421_11g336670 [Arachis hypogaea]|nr:uncharacterized protein DS421_11g336670 [Arachis hypogaea]